MSSDPCDLPSVLGELLTHTLGEATPLQVLLRTGAFPPGWAERYRELFEAVKGAHAEREQWPRELVAAVYTMSVYCTKRYHDWQESTGGVNEQTERWLQRLRWANDELVVGWFWRQKREVRPSSE